MKISRFTIVRIIFTVCYLVCMGVLIWESCLNGPESSSQSNVVGEVLADVINTVIGGGKTEVITDYESFFAFVRKAVGHFGAFLIFGVFSALTYMLWFMDKKWYWSAPLTVVQGIALAMITEGIQTQIPGRCGNFKDVWIDSSGCLVGILVTGGLIILITHLTRKKKGQ